jgi:hypothetical protein
MRYGEERGPQSSTFKSLEVNAIFFETEKIWKNLITKVMKEYSWDTPPTVVLTGFLTKRIETVMESINVVIDDEEVGAFSKGEEIQSIPEKLPTPSADMVKPSSST